MYINSLKALFTTALLSASASLHAQTSFNEVIDRILDNNSELKSQIVLIEAQRLDDADANSLADPEVSVSRVWGRHGIGNKLQLDIAQEIQWPGIYAEINKAAAFTATAGTVAYQAARTALKTQVTQTLLELVYVRQQMNTVRRLADNIAKLNDAIDKGVKGGELTIIDKKKAEMESYGITNSLNTLCSREKQIIANLQGMTSANLNLSDISAYPVQPVHSLEEYKTMAEISPAVAEQLAIVDQETQNAKVAHMSRFPTFTVGYQHQAEMGDRFNGFTFGMNLPVFQGRHARKAALERKNAAQLTGQSIIERQNGEIDALYSELLINKKQIEDYDRVFGDNKYLEYVLKAYEGGQISVLEYITEVQYYNELTQTRLDSEYNYHTALSSLNQYIIAE